MIIEVKKAASAGYRQHPEGVFKAKLVEVVTHNKKTGKPMALTEDDGTVKPRICLIFQTEATYEDEGGVTVHETIWDWHNIPESLANESSNLHKRLVGLGVKIEEGKDVNTDDWLGLNAKLTIDYNPQKDKSKIILAKKLDDADAFPGADYEPYNEVA